MMHYPKIRILGHKDNDGVLTKGDYIYIEEKIDGGNFRFMLTEEGKLYFGSRKIDFGTEDIEMGGQFHRCIEYVKKNINRKNLEKFGSSFIFFGENCIKHTVNYDWEKIPPYLAYDIYNLETGKFIDGHGVQDICQILNLPMVPVIAYDVCGQSVIDSWVTRTEFPSEYAVDEKAEGIVIKNYDKQIFAKIVDPRFKEKNKEKFGKGRKWAENDTERFLAIYCTNARIEKFVFKLIDNGHKLDRTMMKHLPVGVYKDIWEEEWEEIIFTKFVLDTQSIKKAIAKRCLIVLDDMMINNALNEVK